MRVLFLLSILLCQFATMAQKEITLSDIYEKNTFVQRSVSSIRWMNDGQYYTALQDNAIVRYDVATGEAVETLVDGSQLNPSLQIDDYSFSVDERQLLLMTEREGIYRRSYRAQFFVYDRQEKAVTQLTEEGKQSYATFSPDGSKIAFVRDNNLFYVTLESGEEVQVTDDGRFNHIINGSTDWVYEEELYLTKAFFWSPDSQKLAFYRFDESKVKEYNLQLWNKGALYPEDYRYKYPKAGEVNSTVSIHVFHLEGGKSVVMDIGTETDIYIPRISWTKNPNLLSIRRMNRLQNRLDILHVDPATGKSTLILTEKSDTYIPVNQEMLLYLEDGKHFLRTSEQDGFNHLYLYDMEGKLVHKVTNGSWEIDELVGVDQSKKTPTVYFISTEVSPLERHFYAIGLDGEEKEKLTKAAGTYGIDMSSDFSYYIRSHSSKDQPLKVQLFNLKKNKSIKVLEENAMLTKQTKEFNWVEKEFFTFKTSENVELDGYFLKPIDFDDKKSYPVLMYQYSGPGSQQVLNSWGGRHNAWHQMLTQKGYIIVVVDGRGTGGRGAEFKKITYGQLGKYETIDQIETARYLTSLPYIDKDRIGIWGWSYGGYMSSLCMMLGADAFKAGIAVAPVTSWRYYDTIYTERYLKRPQDNPSGYDDNSPLSHVTKLEGAFLLAHGTGDDNVHVQNSIALQERMIEEGKLFQSYFYPDKTHGISGMTTRMHLFQTMTDFILSNL